MSTDTLDDDSSEYGVGFEMMGRSADLKDSVGSGISSSERLS